MSSGLRWTEEEYRAWLARQHAPLAVPPPDPAGCMSPPARGGLRVPQESVPADRYRSMTERRYAEYLAILARGHQVRAWYYEPCKGLYLAPKTTYTPDFLVIWETTPTVYEFHEVKGAFIREKDWIKVKLAAAMYPCFRFLLAQWKDGQWTWRGIPQV